MFLQFKGPRDKEQGARSKAVERVEEVETVERS